MPPRLGDSTTGGAASQNANGAASNSSATPVAAAAQPPPTGQQRPQYRAPPAASNRDDDPIDIPEDDDAKGGGFPPRKRFDEYSKLAAGEYGFIACVNQIVRWEKGVSLQFKVIAPRSEEHDGRQIEWQQSPPGGMSSGFLYYWRQRFFGAYAAGGWTVEANPSTGWGGWQESSSVGANGKKLPLPPYGHFFVVHDSGLWIPTMLEVTVGVDAGYEDFAKVTAVRPLVVDGRRVQAPMPWRVIDWIAESLGWAGTTEGINKATRPVVNLDYKQIQQGAGGLMWHRDAFRRIGEIEGKPYAPRTPKSPPAANGAIPF